MVQKMWRSTLEIAAYEGEECVGHQSLAESIRAVLAEVDRLAAIVAKLPKTADGVPVVPGMELWHAGTAWSDKGDYAWSFYRRRNGELEVQFILCNVLLSDCYSTREAANHAESQAAIDAAEKAAEATPE